MKIKKFYHYTLAVLCFFAACYVSKKALKPLDIAFDKQGHRGARGLMPENTIPAMFKALELGVTTLEMDVVISKDKKVVLSHEPYFSSDISTAPDGHLITPQEEKSLRIYGMTYEEIRKYDVGMRPHPRFPRQKKIPAYKPLLGELLDSVAAWSGKQGNPLPYFNIETKSRAAGDNTEHPAPEEFVELVMKEIVARKIQEKVIIQSFDFRTLQYLHAHYPSIQTAMLVESFDGNDLAQQLKTLGFVPSIYSPPFQIVTKEMIADCHQRGIRIIPWTVNDKNKITQLTEWGVDGIISDYPDLF